MSMLVSIGRLIHLDGPHGAGKTSLARRYVEDHPLALVVDIDDLRTDLGQWATRESAAAFFLDCDDAIFDLRSCSLYAAVVMRMHPAWNVGDVGSGGLGYSGDMMPAEPERKTA